ncbi:hypothetical protein KR222_004434 [Zaprionus bogoriensis]|nr:hypothetical protein KR222_004434 [Zaprionus bogoriensis]
MSEIPQNDTTFTLSSPQLSAWRSQFFALPLNRLAQNVCTTSDPIGACLRPEAKLLSVGGKERYGVPDLIKATGEGPNWICTGLDLLRLAMPKECELSVPYLVYWQKLERCNYFLNSVVELLARCEPLDGRTFQYLMKHAVPDGGTWHMFANLVQKYGVMPSKCYLASWSSTRSLHLNKMLKSKLHEFSSQLHAQFTFDGDCSNLPPMVEVMLEQIFKVISICLGTPPLEFSWHFKDDSKSQTYTALGFYERFVAPYFELSSKICLGNDPRLSSSYQRNYSIAYSSNMTGGQQQNYNNQRMEVLLEIMVASLGAGSAVWLVCDLQTMYKAKTDITTLSLSVHNFDQVFGMPVGSTLSKAERMLYKDTRRNTVLLLTEVIVDEQKQPLQFCTIGKAKETPKKSQSTVSLLFSDHKGMSAEDYESEEELQLEQEVAPKRKGLKGKSTLLNIDWLREYAFEIVVDSRFVPPGVLHALHTQPIVELPIWDPMGALLG